MEAAAKPQFKQRKYPRRDFHRGMGVLNEGRYWVVTGGDIGEGGGAFFSSELFQNAQQMVISFQIPKGSFVTARIEIRASRKDQQSGRYILGFSFLNLKFDHKKEVRAYVSANTAMARTK